jgi:hypothetical protein
MRQVGKMGARAAALMTAALVINSAVMHSSAAQIAALPQPEYSLRDENNVDLLSFNVYLELTDLSIGAKEHPLTHTIYSEMDGNWPDGTGATGAFIDDQFNYSWLEYECIGSFTSPCPKGISRTNCITTLAKVYVEVHFQHTTETFAGCQTYTAVRPTGDTLVYNSQGTYNYTLRDGTIVVFNPPPLTGAENAKEVLYPDGRVLTFWTCADGPGAAFLCSATRSDGLQLKYNYTQNSSGYWLETSVTAINNAYEYCNPAVSTCALKMAWPTATYAFTAVKPPFVLTVTDAADRVTRYTTDSLGRTIGIKLPSSATADNFTYTYCDSNCPQYTVENVPYQWYVASVIRDGRTWTYNGNPGSDSSSCGTATYGFTNPVGSGKQVTLNNCYWPDDSPPKPGFSPLIKLTDEDGVQFNMNNFAQPANTGPLGLLNYAIKPEGNQTNYIWDGRGNLTKETLVPKPNSPLTPVPLLANYDATCTIPVKCNKPNWVKDGLLNETDYTYDPTHGGVLTATLPAVTVPPGTTPIRPQTRYTYVQRYAWVLSASGTYVKSAAPIWVIATESFCRTTVATSSGCTVASDQVVKTYEYGPDSGPNNLFLRGFAVTADGVTHRTCYGHDRFGNKISETEADAGLTSCP